MDLVHRRSIEPLAAGISADPRLSLLTAWGRRLAELGVSPAASGNLSCRSAAGFVITATGVPLGAIEPDHWVEVTAVEPMHGGGLQVDSRGMFEPSRDSAVHAATYRRVPQASCVFHLHPDYLHELVEHLGVPATGAYYRAGTVESVREIERFLDATPGADYFVLVEHGIVCTGPTIDAAGTLVEQMHRAVLRQGRT
jgi:ribulose-5-phosphate 4-epimerase/fuculose-1-phosphate aldolase